MKAIKYIAIGGAAFLVGKYLLSLKRAEKQVVIVTTGKKDKITIQGITLLVRYNIKNPTDANMRMTPPLVKLIVDGKLIGTSDMTLIDIPENVRDKTGKIVIRAFKETGNIETRIFIPWINLIPIAPDLVKRLKSSDKKDQISVSVVTNCQLYTPIGNFPYSQTSKMTL